MESFAVPELQVAPEGPLAHQVIIAMQVSESLRGDTLEVRLTVANRGAVESAASEIELRAEGAGTWQRFHPPALTSGAATEINWTLPKPASLLGGRVQDRALADLFAATPRDFTVQPLPQDAAETVTEDLGPGGRAALPDFSMTDLMQGLYEALDLPLEDILRFGWASLVELQEYRDEKKHPPGEINSLRFGKHKITSKHQPSVKVLLNDQQIASLAFNVTVMLHITATTLTIRDGSIWQARGSKVMGDGTVAYRDFTLLQAKTRELQVPGQIEFEDGIPIPPLPRAAI